MSTVDDDPQVSSDQRAGRSSYCRREQHQTCSSVRAKCACACHGRTAQAPPAPLAVVPPLPPVQIVPEPQEATMPEPEPVRRPSTPNPDGYPCADCGLVFPTSGGLGGHRKVHRTTTNPPAPKPERRTPPAPKHEEPATPHLVIATHDGSDHLARFQTEPDAAEAVDLLTMLGIDAARWTRA